MSPTEMASRLKQASNLIDSVRDALNPGGVPVHHILDDKEAAKLNSLDTALRCMGYVLEDLGSPDAYPPCPLVEGGVVLGSLEDPLPGCVCDPGEVHDGCPVHAAPVVGGLCSCDPFHRDLLCLVHGDDMDLNRINYDNVSRGTEGV